jgi:PAS domain S-box-containing protein
VKGNTVDFQGVFERGPGLFLVLLPDSPVFTIAAASEAEVELSGLRREDLIGRGIFEAFPPGPSHELDGLRASLDKVVSSKAEDRVGIQRYDINSEERYWSAVNTPIMSSGDEGSGNEIQYILHSVQDITERVLSERKAQSAQNERERFRQLSENSVIGLMIGCSDGEISYANSALLNMLGYTRDELNAGIVRWDQLSPPEYAELDAHCRSQVATKGKCAPYEKVWIARDGRRVPILLGASALQPLDGRREFAGFALDITESRRHRRDAFLLKLEDATHSLSDPGEIVQTAVSLLREQLGADRCAHHLFEPDEDRFDTPWESCGPGTVPVRGRRILSEFSEEGARLLRAGQPWLVESVESDSRTAASAKLYERVGVKALAAVPLLKDGRLVASLVLHQCRERAWLPEEVELIQVVANRCWESRERAEAVRALQMSEQRLRLAQRAGRIGTFETFVREDRVVWSPEMEALFEIPENSFEGNMEAWRRRVYPEDDAVVMTTVHHALEQGLPEFSYEFRAIMPSGDLRWMRGQTRAYYDGEGLPLRLVGVAIDVHSQKLAEAKLRESEQRLRAIFDGTHEYIGLLSPDGIITEANRASLEHAGNTPAQIIGTPFWKTPLFQSRPGLEETIRTAVLRAAAGESVRMEIGCQSPEGQPVDFDISLLPVRNEQGEVVMIVTEGRNITEQKQDKERLRRQWELFDTVLSNTPDLLYTYDLEGRFTYANRSLVAVSQRPLEGTVGKTVFEVGWPRELAEKVFADIQRVVRTGEPVRDQIAFHTVSGEVRDYEYIYVPVRGSDGSVSAIAGSTRDVTDRRKAEERERDREAQLRESARLESLGIMAGGIAHDFNNLLVGVMGNASLLEECLMPEDRHMAKEIVLAAERAAELTRQMLAYSGKGRFLVEVFDLNELIRENLTLLRASLSRSLTVDFDLNSKPCFVEADRTQIHQIVLNLLINASEAIGDRSGKVSVQVTQVDRVKERLSPLLHVPVAAGRYAQLVVQDDGCGMSPETLARIFDPFFTTKFTGRGLGLAATLGIVKGHKGEIEVESAPGAGTTFRILLPATASPQKKRPAKRLSEPSTAANRIILVVDDEEVVRRMATAALESRGFKVLTAGNGTEALETIQARRDISLVILDLTMPVMTGEEALPLIQDLDPQLPVVLSSGFGEAEIARRFESRALAGVLQKPYTIGALMAKVTKALTD